MPDDPFAPYDPIFQAAGSAWNVDPLLLRALAGQESPDGNPHAVSKAGAQGLMQIMPQTQKQLGVEDPFDPVQSIFGAAKYMDEALTAEGNPETALLYYHGGPGWRKTFSQSKESQGYLPSIIARYQRFKAAAQPPAPTASAQANNGE
jgi:soluble lytic murein transglycosylase-like protein